MFYKKVPNIISVALLQKKMYSFNLIIRNYQTNPVWEPLSIIMGFPSDAVKESACQCRRCKRHRFDPWVRKTPWRRAWQLIQYSCLENPMDRAWRATVHRVAKSLTWLSTHALNHNWLVFFKMLKHKRQGKTEELSKIVEE